MTQVCLANLWSGWLFGSPESSYPARVAHPYRTQGSSLSEKPDPYRLGFHTLTFGVVCTLRGIALAGLSRPYMNLALGIAGPIVITSRRG